MATQIYNGRFELVEEIARGGYARVWQAVDKDKDAVVAVKLQKNFDSENHGRSIREEASLLAELKHPNIVKCQSIPMPGRGGASVPYACAVELSRDPWFFVMEYLSGANLQEYIDQVGPLSVPETVSIILPIISALKLLHEEHTFAHYDVKLENVVFRNQIKKGAQFDPVLIDFGIAARMKLQIEVRGAPYSMPPEMVKMAPPESRDPKKVDVWGLGIIAYALVTGRLPFKGKRTSSLTDSIVSTRPESISRISTEVPKNFDALIIDGCLAKRPLDRISLAELERQLSAFGTSNARKAPRRTWRNLFRK